MFLSFGAWMLPPSAWNSLPFEPSKNSHGSVTGKLIFGSVYVAYIEHHGPTPEQGAASSIAMWYKSLNILGVSYVHGHTISP